jgi:MoaA/NifB/PqqE/SkfB family radical SAM enzyme
MAVLTSTNGIILDDEGRMSEIINSGIDTIIFSIDGATESSYLKYHIGGDFRKALSNMGKFIEIRNKMHAKKPLVVWQYVLFRWNDSREEIRSAQGISKKIGVDKLVFHTTAVPIFGISARSVSYYIKNLFKFAAKREKISLISERSFN